MTSGEEDINDVSEGGGYADKDSLMDVDNVEATANITGLFRSDTMTKLEMELDSQQCGNTDALFPDFESLFDAQDNWWLLNSSYVNNESHNMTPNDMTWDNDEVVKSSVHNVVAIIDRSKKEKEKGSILVEKKPKNPKPKSKLWKLPLPQRFLLLREDPALAKPP
jgi:hypothetical protein